MAKLMSKYMKFKICTLHIFSSILINSNDFWEVHIPYFLATTTSKQTTTMTSGTTPSQPATTASPSTSTPVTATTTTTTHTPIEKSGNFFFPHYCIVLCFASLFSLVFQ